VDRPYVLYGKGRLTVDAPPTADVIIPPFAEPLADARAALSESLAKPMDSPPLAALAERVPTNGRVVIVISDITRPVPNDLIVPAILDVLACKGIEESQVAILVATGLHRPSTKAEKIEMLGRAIVERYRIIDHQSGAGGDEAQSHGEASGEQLVPLPGVTRSGTRAYVNRCYAEADLRIVTGFIEPHFMAGYSGGRKAICPGLVNLATVQKFHGPGFLEDPRAQAGILDGNPCHEEALDVARAVGVDFLVNVTVDMQKRITGVFSGHFESAHRAGVAFVERTMGVPVRREYDVVITCGGGYPLDATFYQSVKGMVLATPFVRQGGVMVVAASCSEGIGSVSYRQCMFEYPGRWREFLEVICRRDLVVHDQWQFEMQCRTLRKTDVHGLFYVTDGLDEATLHRCSVRPARGCGSLPAQTVLDGLVRELRRRHAGDSWAVIPTGPYILPQNVPGAIS